MELRPNQEHNSNSRESISDQRGTLYRSVGERCPSGHPSVADHRILLQIVDALKTSEGASAPYIVYCIRFEVSPRCAWPASQE